MKFHPIVQTLVREPLLHFLLIGAAVFLLFQIKNGGTITDDNRIVITVGTIKRMSALWEKNKHRPPTQAELQTLIEQQIREQVMFREALALGLDKNDAFIRRRLAQKIEFITSDLAALAEPSEKQLNEFFISQQTKFQHPARLNFEHVYFSHDKRGAMAEHDALEVLGLFKQPGSTVAAENVGDPFILGNNYEQITAFEAAGIFGETFATELFQRQQGAWQGPIPSSYGAHLIRISRITPAKAVELNAIREKVVAEWQAQQRKIMNDTFYDNLRRRYEIVVESLTENNVAEQQNSVRYLS